jgi:GGDEF domain-containing protein
MATEGTPGAQPELVLLEGVRAQRFLRSLADRPFVAVVLEGDETKVVCKGMTSEQAARIMQSLANQIEQEQHADT